jgi:hypothetical protein
MRFTLARGKRPAERLRLSVDFANDLGATDNPQGLVISVVDVTDPGTDLTATMIENPTLVGSVGSAILKAGAAGKSYAMLFQLTAASTLIYQHDILVKVLADA